MLNEEISKNLKPGYYIGVDIGTDSVGYAVTDRDYSLCRFKGEPMTGTTLFDKADQCADRRSHRTARRRYDRRQMRVDLIQELFCAEMSKVDPNFFIRINESYLWQCDKSPETLVGCEWSDKGYNRDFPTIHHLIMELIKEEKGNTDIRHLYLAVAWLVAHRGHFLSNISCDKIDDLYDIEPLYKAFIDWFNENGYSAPWECDAGSLMAVMSRNCGVRAKETALKNLIFDGKKPVDGENCPLYREAIIKLLAGYSIEIKKTLKWEEYKDFEGSICLDDAEKLEAVLAELGDDGEVIRLMSQIYDCAALSKMLDGHTYISETKIEQYDTHKSDLRKLKQLVKKYCSKDEYKEFFVRATGAYPSYTAHFKSSAQKKGKWSYEDICGTEFRVILNSECYGYNESTGTFTDLRKTDAGLRYLYDNGLKLKVSGIIRPSDDAQSAMLTGSIAYTSKLTEYVIEQAKNSAVIKAQLDDPTTDVFTGLPFKSNTSSLTDKEKADELRAFIAGLDTDGKVEMFIKMKSIPSEEELNAMTDQAMAGYTRAQIEAAMIEQVAGQMGVDADTVKSYIASMRDEELFGMFREGVKTEIKSRYADGVREQINAQIAAGQTSAAQLAAGLDYQMSSMTDEQCAVYYGEIMEFAPTSYEENLNTVGYIDLDSPTAINIYASSFENKEIIEDAIAEYNDGMDEIGKIKYTDYVGLMMSSIVTIINSITYVLIAFVAISLVVSSIMIGVITLISVQERTKEIGILRAIGASKHDVSSMFNAETLIIGFASGLLGILVTYLLCIPINLVLHALTGLTALNAMLPWWGAVSLVVISMLLTLIAGLIPSRSAAKKDPVVALRTE